MLTISIHQQSTQSTEQTEAGGHSIKVHLAARTTNAAAAAGGGRSRGPYLRVFNRV
jgi:hypothetical protein